MDEGAAPADPVRLRPAPAVPATPAASLLPEVPAVPAAAPVVPATPATPATPAAPAPQKWFYSDGVEGKGNAPDWFKSGKYVTVEQQAKAYPDLEKRFGSFVGAPDGEYVITVPEAFKDTVQVDTAHPVFKKLTDWGKKQQLSQDGFNDVIGLLTEYEHSTAPPERTIDVAKKEIGANADTRLAAVSNYIAANLDAAGQAAVRAAIAIDNPAIAQTLEAIERVIAKTRQPAMPKPGTDVPPSGANELAEINAAQAKVNPATGKRFYVEDSVYRTNLEARRARYNAAQAGQ